MSLSEIPVGTQVLLDVNVQAYHFLQVEPLARICDALFRRIARREIEAFTPAGTAADVIHRVMVAEAVARFGLPSREAVSYLKAHPQAVKELQQYKTIPHEFTLARIHILDITYKEIHNSKQFRDEYGMLTNDSIILAVMREHKLVHLVTNDDDFERVPGIQVWMPR
jgi:predicted nucleic acid-binding protein